MQPILYKFLKKFTIYKIITIPYKILQKALQKIS